MRAHGKNLGLVPYDLRAPGLEHARKRLWNAGDERFLVLGIFGFGWALNLGSVPRHPLGALLVTALLVWRWRAGRRG